MKSEFHRYLNSLSIFFLLLQINRDKDGSGSVEGQLWGQPKVKLERLGLVKDFEKRPKPVVVLKKLSVDQIQRIIRHSKSGKNRFSSGKSGKSKNIKLWNCKQYYSTFKSLYIFFPSTLPCLSAHYSKEVSVFS